jgi:hypothetical protein
MVKLLLKVLHWFAYKLKSAQWKSGTMLLQRVGIHISSGLTASRT